MRGRNLLLVAAAGAVVYAARDVLLGLSLTVTALLLFLAFVAWFVVGATLDAGLRETAAFSLGAVTYLAFVGYVVVEYAPGLVRMGVLLAVGTLVFALLWIFLRSPHVQFDRRPTLRLLAGLLAVAVVLIYLDATGPGVRVLFAPLDTVTVPPVAAEGPLPHSTTQQRVGTVTASNPSMFARSLALPSLSGCLAATADAPSEAVQVSYEPAGTTPPASLTGGTTLQYAVYASFPGSLDRTEPETLRIERGADCERPRDSPTLVVSMETGG